MAKTNLNALFLGPKSENKAFFSEMLRFLMEDHISWRENFHPEDPPLITPEEHDDVSFQDTLQKTREVLIDLAGRLEISSNPWFSPRYLGHMNSDTIMAANLGYMLALLYNPNNCAYEGSPATTELELEVGLQLARMLGYDPDKAWGHITSGGTIANYEAIWIARNLKSIPLAVKKVSPDLVSSMSDWELLNQSPGWILDLMDRVKAEGCFEEVRDHSIRGRGMSGLEIGKILVPQSKHYSWNKAADILGIGLQNIQYVPVKSDFRMDIKALAHAVDQNAVRQIPILAVIGVVGSTEEGAVDNIHEIAALRDTCSAKGISFYFHIDAAYGGYARTVFLDDQHGFLDRNSVIKKFQQPNLYWPSMDLYQAFKAMPQADSVTIDPHKLGYIPYSAGGFILKDKRVLDLISYFAAYTFGQKEEIPGLLGAYIMEGSKPGAAAAAVWTAHELLALHQDGYGEIIRCGIEGAANFFQSLRDEPPITIGNDRFMVEPLIRPDLNMVDFAFNRMGNVDLSEMNRLNQAVYDESSFRGGPLYANEWIASKTSLNRNEYGEAPLPFIEKFGIPSSEWDHVGEVFVLRSTVMTPYLMKPSVFEEYHHRFMKTMRKRLSKAVARF